MDELVTFFAPESLQCLLQQVFGGSVYHRVNHNLESSISLGWTSTSNTTTFGIGAKYALDSVRLTIS